MTEPGRPQNESFYPRLCGGTFFLLLLQALKAQPERRNNKLPDEEILLSLIDIVVPDNNVREHKNSLKIWANTFKHCSKKTSKELEITDEKKINRFDQWLRSDRYRAVLQKMIRFAAKYLDPDKKDDLARVLADLILQDQTIKEDDEFIIGGNEKTITKADIAAGNCGELVYEAFLLGVWHFVITNRKDNTIGRDTDLTWCGETDPEKKGDVRPYQGNMGENVPSSFRVIWGRAEDRNKKTPGENNETALQLYEDVVSGSLQQTEDGWIPQADGRLYKYEAEGDYPNGKATKTETYFYPATGRKEIRRATCVFRQGKRTDGEIECSVEYYDAEKRLERKESYRGGLKNDLWHGSGAWRCIVYESGEKKSEVSYKGDYAHGDSDGRGTYDCTVSPGYSEHYEGAFQQGKYSGEGELTVEDTPENTNTKVKRIFNGKFENNEFRGCGTCKFEETSAERIFAYTQTYESRFISRESYTGEKEEISKSRSLVPERLDYDEPAEYIDRTKGFMIDGKWSGKGEQEMKAINRSGELLSDISYNGGFQENCWNGHGTLTFRKTDARGLFADVPPTAQKYVGQFRNAYMQGVGTLTLQNGCEITGSFYKNKPRGECSISLPNGCVYVLLISGDGSVTEIKSRETGEPVPWGRLNDAFKELAVFYRWRLQE